jgi:hypothetical protein
MSDVLAKLPDVLIHENGGGYGFVCIWRHGDSTRDSARRCTVEEFLSQPENQSGVWYIDGGWGGPPGPIMVSWENGQWINYGFPPHTCPQYTRHPF